MYAVIFNGKFSSTVDKTTQQTRNLFEIHQNDLKYKRDIARLCKVFSLVFLCINYLIL